MTCGGRLYVGVLCSFLCLSLMGCESMQRKFTRKPKHPIEAPSPIISFQDYSKAMTPLERYRKHYLMFNYWNDGLLEELQERIVNPKGLVRASEESLSELETLHELLAEVPADRLAPLVAERRRINEQLHSSQYSHERSVRFRRLIERQTRKIQHDFFWRDVEEHLKPPATETSEAP